MIKQVQEHKNIDVYLGTEVAEVKGHIGEFHATLSCNGQKSEVSGGAVIVATGAERAETTKFLGGASANVTTQVELEKQIHEGRLPAGTEEGRHDPVRRLARRRASLLQPHLLLDGDQERLGDQGEIARDGYLRPLSRHPDLWLPRDLL